jgi:hypothetical protein
VDAYKVWEMQGGSRLSLFSAGGAQRPASDGPPPFLPDAEWNFSPTDDEEIELNQSDPRVVFGVHGADVELPSRQPRRRRPPPGFKAFNVPLEKVFDPHTTSNYDENARGFYSKATQLPTTDLPSRNSSVQPAVRESLIDLDLSLDGGDLSQFADMETIKPASRPALGTLVDDCVDRRRI